MSSLPSLRSVARVGLAAALLGAPGALAAAAPAPPAPAAPATRLTVEVFRVGLDDRGGIAFARFEGPLVGGENPDTRARGLAATDAANVAALHSTSWRWEPDGRIVLTYLAWMKDGRLGEARPLPPLAPPRPTDPRTPRPAEIRELDPLAHGLRHLAFLLRHDVDGRLAAALGERAVAALRQIEPEVAGELRTP
jgi:hypothetical protein